MESLARTSSQSEYERIFEEIRIPSMTPLMYKTLDKVKLPSVWDAISAEIIPELTNGGYYVVPYPEEARDYGLFNVFVKVYDCCCGKILGKPRKYRHVTKLQQVVRYDKNDDFNYLRDNAFYGIRKDFIYEGAGRSPKDGVLDKTMLFIVRGMKKLSSDLNQVKKNELVISRENGAISNSKKSVYVVSEVVEANYMTLQASVGDRKRRWEYNGPIPLAFKLTKFNLRPSGHLFRVDPSEILPRWDDTEAIRWERPSESRDRFPN